MNKLHLSRQIKNDSSGYVLLLTLLEGVVFLIIITAVIQLGLVNYKSARSSMLNLGALSVAEAGAEKALLDLNVASGTFGDYGGTTPAVANQCSIASSSTTHGSAITFFNDSTRGRGTYETCFQNNDDPAQGRHEKVLYALGKIYQPASASVPSAVKRIKIVLTGEASGEFSVIAGPGSLVVNNKGNVASGGVYVNGTITLTNSASIGSAGTPSKVYAGNFVCPKTAPYTSYPALCADGTGGITVDNTSHIYADVRSNGQTNTSGMSNSGLVASSGVTQSPFPPYDRDAQKAAVSTTINGNFNCGSGQTLTLQANTKINGDLNADHTCVLTILGNIWVTGNFTLRQSAVVKPDPSLTTIPTMMIDGSSGISFQNQASVAANANNVGIQFITYWSMAACSPDCADVSDGDLFNSVDHTTMDLNNQTLAAASRFLARWSRIDIGQGGTIGAVIGQKIVFRNQGSITFTSAAAITILSWRVRYYESLPVPDFRHTN